MRRIGIVAVAAALGAVAGATPGQERPIPATTSAGTAITAPEVVLQENPPAPPIETDPRDAEAHKKITAICEELAAEQQSLEKVLLYMAECTKANVRVNWKAVEGAGVDRNTTVSVQLRKVPWDKVLRIVLTEAGGGGDNLDWTISNGVVEISTRDDLCSTRFQVVHVYDANAFLWCPSAPGEAEDEQLRNLLTTIEATVAPDTWRDAGGTVGVIHPIRGYLIVNQTRENHLAIQELLTDMAKTGAITVRCYPVRDLVGDAGHERTGAPDEPPARPARVQALIATIEKMVAPRTWQEQNGTQGSIAEFDGRLFIRTTNDRHQKIAELLAQLRKK